jgi:pyridoxamine 5'-phosphate oxidase
VLPDSFEFWQEMPFRLHDRSLYQRDASGTWIQTKLYP